MEVRKYFREKRADDESSSEGNELTDINYLEDQELLVGQITPKSFIDSKAEKKKAYKAHLNYKKKWEDKFPWVYCKTLRKECSIDFASNEEMTHQQREVDAPSRG